MRTLTNPTAPRKVVRLPLRSLRRLRIPALFFLGLVYLILLLSRARHGTGDVLRRPHPLSERLRAARQQWQAKVRRRSNSWTAFTAEYDRRYHLDLPRGMRAWWTTAQASGHVLADEYDSLMRDLDAFRGFDAHVLHARTLELAELPRISLLNISNGVVRCSRTATTGVTLTCDGLARMLERHGNELPDALMAVNELREPRVIDAGTFHPRFPSSARLGHQRHLSANASEIWRQQSGLTEEGSAWSAFKKTCPPSSSARKSISNLKVSNHRPQHQDRARDAAKSTSKPVARAPKSKRSDPDRAHRWLMSPLRKADDAPMGTLNPVRLDADLYAAPAEEFDQAGQVSRSPSFGFPEETAVTKDLLCGDSKVHERLGAFHSDVNVLPALYPLFGVSKIDGYADILVPSVDFYDVQKQHRNDSHIPWASRKNKLFWRGSPESPGNTPPLRQMHYERQRFVRLAQSTSSRLQSLLAPRRGQSLLHVKRSLGELNRGWMDVGFSSFDQCGGQEVCSVARSTFKLRYAARLKDMALFKIIFDLDANGASKQFLPKLRLGSAVFKATTYQTFASGWMEPFYHYVPVSHTYSELHNLLAFFLPIPQRHTRTRLVDRVTARSPFSNDRALESLGRHAQDWTNTVCRPEDMELYLRRVVLEWARLASPEGRSTVVGTP